MNKKKFPKYIESKIRSAQRHAEIAQFLVYDIEDWVESNNLFDDVNLQDYSLEQWCICDADGLIGEIKALQGVQ